MRVGYISPFPPTRHGVGTYTNYLCNALCRVAPKVGCLVIADKRTAERNSPRLTVVPTFDLDETLGKDDRPDYGGDVLAVVDDRAPNLVHIQQNISILPPDDRFLALLQELHRRTKVILTFHSVFTDGTCPSDRLSVSEADYNRSVGRLVDKIIVHQQSMRDVLIRQGLDGGKIHIIPHGTELIEQVGQIQARQALELPAQGRLIASFGFLSARKNFELLIRALPQVLKEVPDAYLFLSGFVRDWMSEDFEMRERYEKLAAQLGVYNRVLFARDFISDSDLPLIFSAADVLAFPYTERYYSASGALHLAIGALKPVVVSRSPKFEEVATKISRELVFDVDKPWELEKVLIRVLIDSVFRNAIGAKVKDHALNTTWDKVAHQHLQIYESMMRI